MTEELEDRAGPEAAVAAWRRRLLVTAGFDGETAGMLADRHADLHALLGLVDRGCPPHLAGRILAPLDAPSRTSCAPDASSGTPSA